MKNLLRLLAAIILAWVWLIFVELPEIRIGGAGEAIGAELGVGKGKGPIPGELRIGPCNLSGDCRDE